ncbi:unnamed protein product [Didymodactylos carnosus]|uniref:Uncharacterized protein n=1 Tax=Didymodactylos carnosus TaxID=1234261 RepID=A0A815Z2T4_9BILA|nr:unnamed protein product [Didymodactylos carnosus]CAF1579296.1 unnamed protein product [Didymodactylos carnosus]CAF4017994.1 unnamed protein product [Didymodactylos carnosus]CAF4446054.1 unnamed protein product [Didymodactylos carnosus]
MRRLTLVKNSGLILNNSNIFEPNTADVDGHLFPLSDIISGKEKLVVIPNDGYIAKKIPLANNLQNTVVILLPTMATIDEQPQLESLQTASSDARFPVLTNNYNDQTVIYEKLSDVISVPYDHAEKRQNICQPRYRTHLHIDAISGQKYSDSDDENNTSQSKTNTVYNTYDDLTTTSSEYSGVYNVRSHPRSIRSYMTDMQRIDEEHKQVLENLCPDKMYVTQQDIRLYIPPDGFRTPRVNNGVTSMQLIGDQLIRF